MLSVLLTFPLLLVNWMLHIHSCNSCTFSVVSFDLFVGVVAPYGLHMFVGASM
jgi:hypothetical protein